MTGNVVSGAGRATIRRATAADRAFLVSLSEVSFRRYSSRPAVAMDRMLRGGGTLIAEHVLRGAGTAAKVPYAAVPDAAVPGVAVPGVAVPGAAVPGAAVPDAAVPGAAVPGAAVFGGGGRAVRLGFVVVDVSEAHRSVGGLVAPRLAYLAAIAVVPEARGCGLGRELLEAAEELARREGAVSMRLMTATTNVDAQRLFERAGYQPLHPVVGAYVGRQDAIEMWKSLSFAKS